MCLLFRINNCTEILTTTLCLTSNACYLYLIDIYGIIKYIPYNKIISVLFKLEINYSLFFLIRLDYQ